MINTVNIQSILVPVDFSETSLNALESAIVIGKRHQAKIVLLHVLTVPSFSMVGQYDVYPMEVLSLEQEKTAARMMMDRLAQGLYKHGLFIETYVREGNVVDEINTVSESIRADLIVMGASESTPMKKLLMGTNAMSVLKSTETPVLIIPDGKNIQHVDRVLFPIRNVPGVMLKYEVLQQLIDFKDKKVQLLAMEEKENSEHIHNTASIIERYFRNEGVSTQTSFCTTHKPAKEVQRMEDELEIDLVVINANLEYSLSDYFWGPYSERILNQAQIPVLSIRSQMTKESQNIIPQRSVLEERVGQMAFYSKPFIEYN